LLLIKISARESAPAGVLYVFSRDGSVDAFGLWYDMNVAVELRLTTIFTAVQFYYSSDVLCWSTRRCHSFFWTIWMPHVYEDNRFVWIVKWL